MVNVWFDRQLWRTAQSDLFNEDARNTLADSFTQEALARKDELIAQAGQGMSQLNPGTGTYNPPTTAAGVASVPPSPLPPEPEASTAPPPAASQPPVLQGLAPTLSAPQPSSGLDQVQPGLPPNRPEMAQGGFSPYDAVFARYAGEHASNPEFLSIVAAGTLAESGWDTNNQSGDNGHSWGLFQMHDAGAGAGMGPARLDPDAASRVMVPKYAQAYNFYKAQGLSGAQLAAAVAVAAERPDDRQGQATRNYMAAFNRLMGGGAVPSAPSPTLNQPQDLQGLPVVPAGDGTSPPQGVSSEAPASSPVDGLSDWGRGVVSSIGDFITRLGREPSGQELSDFLRSQQQAENDRVATAQDQPYDPDAARRLLGDVAGAIGHGVTHPLDVLGSGVSAVNEGLRRVSPVSGAARTVAGTSQYGRDFAERGGPELERQLQDLQSRRLGGEQGLDQQIRDVGAKLNAINNEISQGQPYHEAVSAAAERNPDFPAIEAAANLGAGVAAGVFSLEAMPIAAKIAAEVLAPGSNVANVMKARDAARFYGSEEKAVQAALDQVRKMPGTAELAPVRGVVEQDETDLLQGLLELAKTRGAEPERLATLQREIDELNVAAATRRALSSRLPGAASARMATSLGGAAASGGTAYETTDQDDPNRLGKIGGATLAGASLGVAAPDVVGRAGPALVKVANAFKPSPQAVQAMQQVVQQAPQRTAVQKIVEVTRGNLLTSPAIAGLQLVGGGLETARRPVGTFLGGLVRADPTSMHAAIDDVAAMGASLGQSLAHGRDALLTGFRASQSAAGQAQYAPLAQGAKGLLVEPGYRLIGAIDEVTRSLNTAGAWAMAARVESKATGRTVKDLLANPTPWMQQVATEAAARTVFEEGGTGLGRAIVEWKARMLGSANPVHQLTGAIADVLLPFAQIPDAIMLEGAKALGHAATLGTIGVAKGVALSHGATAGSKPLAQAERNLLAAQATGGALLAPIVATWAATQALSGNLTGEGPHSWSPAFRQQLQNTRGEDGQPLWKPTSVRVAGRWLTYGSSLGPWAPVLSSVATAIEEFNDTGTLDGKTVGAALNGAAAAAMKLAYLEDLIHFASEASKGNMGRALELKAGQLPGRLPFGGAMGAATRATDEQKQYGRGFEGAAQRAIGRLPVLSEFVPDRQDALGRPIREPQDVASMLVPGRPTVPQQPTLDDRVMRAFTDAGLAIPLPDDHISVGKRNPVTVQINEQEQQRWQQRFGYWVEQQMAKVLTNPAWERASIEERAKALKKITADARFAADQEIAAQLGADEIKRRFQDERSRTENVPTNRPPLSASPRPAPYAVQPVAAAPSPAATGTLQEALRPPVAADTYAIAPGGATRQPEVAAQAATAPAEQLPRLDELRALARMSERDLQALSDELIRTGRPMMYQAVLDELRRRRLGQVA